MEEHDETTTTPESAPAGSDGQGTTQALARDVATLTATVDQHSAEIDAISREQLVLVFALGALAGIVFLHHREIRSLARDLAG